MQWVPDGQANDGQQIPSDSSQICRVATVIYNIKNLYKEYNINNGVNNIIVEVELFN
jgi:hypothetical protein